jgi:hypothetical protein
MSRRLKDITMMRSPIALTLPVETTDKTAVFQFPDKTHVREIGGLGIFAAFA